MDDGHARVKMQDVERHIAETRFAWVGGTDPDERFLLPDPQPGHPHRVRSSADGEPASSDVEPEVPQRQHIHVVVRTPNGNDYGKDLLRQHLATHTH